MGRMVAALIVWALAVGAARGEARITPIYDLYFGGVWAAELLLDARIGAERYDARAQLTTKGMIGAVYGAAFDVTAQGRVGADWRPERFLADTRAGRKAQLVEITYDGTRPAALRAEPEFDPRPWELDPYAQTGAPDPLSAALSVLGPRPQAQVCNDRVEVFDGRRRIAIAMERPQSDPAREPEIGPHQPRLRCAATYTRVAGFKPKLMARQRDFPFTVWFQREPDGLYHLTRAEGPTPLGLAIVLRRH